MAGNLPASNDRLPTSTRAEMGWLRAGFWRQMRQSFRFRIPPGESILECGCGRGQLLHSMDPSRAVGYDPDHALLAQAVTDPRIEYRPGLLPTELSDERFDHIVLNHLLGSLPDVQVFLQQLQKSAHPGTRLHLSTLNAVWELPLQWARRLGIIPRVPPANWLSHDDISNLLELAGWEIVAAEHAQLLPVEIPLVSALFNRVLVRLPLVRHLGLSLVITARPRRAPALSDPISCSVVVPARNEAGNIRGALERIPVLGRGTEIIFVEGNSTDDTWETIQREVAAYRGPHVLRAMRQPGKGKWDAVFTGFQAATGDVLVIQDGDLTAPPEDLPKFFAAIVQGDAEFANGSRLVYPMEKEAMRFLNLLGNKFFATALSFVLGQRVKDSLCGTKMITRHNYERLLRRIESFGDFDPFGDFNLLFGSALLNLRIRDIPVRYKDRTYGSTNISRFYHGSILLRMTWFGLRKIRFHP